MKSFTAFDYILIDIANQYGKDKLLFEERIQWVKDNINNLEVLAKTKKGKWKEKPLYLKAIQTLQKIREGQATGHMVGFDATCSGLQIMSATTGCHKGANATGLVDPNKRADAYTQCMNTMRKWIPALAASARSDIKLATMTAFYGSKAEPERLFGEGSPELQAFYKSLLEMAPGACQLLEVLRDAWQPWELSHNWVLPDNHHVNVKVLSTIEKRLEVDELNHTKFTYRYKQNIGKSSNVSLIANVIHSLDAYLLRTVIRRCNYNKVGAMTARNYMHQELLNRDYGAVLIATSSDEINTAIARYKATGIADIYVLNFIDKDTVKALSTEHLQGLYKILTQMLEHSPFEVITVH